MEGRMDNLCNRYTTGSIYYQKFESEKTISQIVGISEDWDQNGDRVSNSNNYNSRELVN